MKRTSNKENKQDLFEQFYSSIGALSNLISDEVIQKLKHLDVPKEDQEKSSLESVFLDTDQACDFLKTTEPTLRKYVKAGRIKKYVKGQRGNLYKRSDLIKFIEDGSK